ncbi:3-epi-6-deoxocathasterone 23-monooxygenase CYP90C1 isoform X2 [Vitis vinifera]|uniref:3-epi-6-deoxocathasterone 23-monooxygenase CYP90C1 isoform X2 n=1 Tax=Vitis vinifera TaxID=29760 RepID=UPI00053FB99F|nr:3-epi-6-deoxocathasterone 23-monooxygenase CYP90C1 isoform X2 [Vitis vinifera]|eukprot:XP_010649090.1 PREDICTED: 3-epi-6-deoxocathasterone 23-monooxygenase isoform X2 [Vitis vinifera]
MEVIHWCWVVVGVVMGWCWYKSIKNKAKEEGSGVPRGNPGWPVIGETLDFIASGWSSRPVSFMEKRKSRYGKVFKTNILGKPVIVSTDPEVNKVVLQNIGNVFIPAYPQTITEILGESSILQMNGSLQKRVHALLGGFLRSPQLKARITRDIERYVKLTLDSWKDQHIVYVQDEVRKITFDVLVRVLVSITPGEDLNFMKREFAEVIKGLICLPIKLPGTRLYKSLKAKERLLKLVRRIVEERKAAMDRGDHETLKGPPNDAVDVLLRDTGDSSETSRLSLDFISSNMIEMMIPGEETLPTAMTLAVKFLSDCPVALNQLMEENMELKKGKALSGEDYAWTDYMCLPFTQNVINETLRMANIINAVWRKAVKDVKIKDYLIPEGWGVMASFTSIHMDEENYENPYQFNPWRWEAASVNNNNSYTPFGGGQRLCPGLELSKLEISIFLHHLVTTYRWVAKKDDVVYFPTVKMRKKLPITVTPLPPL